MKVTVVPEHGQTFEEAEEQLEKAIRIKRQVEEQQYARESYKNEHLDQFHDAITELHAQTVDTAVKEITDLLKFKLRV